MSSDNVYVAGGVYEAIPGRLAVGPMVHVKLLISKPPGTLFGKTKLGEARSRYFVSCLPIAPSLPPLATSSPAPENRHHDPTADGAGSASGNAPVSGPSSVPPTPPPPSAANSGAGQGGSLSKPPMSGNRNVADFLAKMKERQAVARRPSSGLTSPLAAPSPAASTTPSVAGESLGSPREEDGHVTDQAATNTSLKQLAADTLGPDHFHVCHMSTEKLQAPHTMSTVERIQKILHDDPNAFVYVFSGSGKNRASALAMLYLLESEKLPLQDITKRLLLSTPRIQYMMELLALEKARATAAGSPCDFDGDAYFTRYYAMRYPDRSTKAVRAAVESSNGDYARADRILQEEVFFTKSVADTNKQRELLKAANATEVRPEQADLSSQTFGGFEDREQSRLSFFNGSFTSHLSENRADDTRFSAVSNSALSTSKGNREMENSTSRRAPAILGMPNLVGMTAEPVPADAQSTASRSSATPQPLPASALTPVDDEMIRTLVRGLRNCDVGTTPEEVRESYLRHRRNKSKVLGDFLKNGADNTKIMHLAHTLPTTVHSHTPRSSAADSSVPATREQNGSLRPVAQRASRGSHTSSRQAVAPPMKREEPSPEPERPSVDDTDECTASDIEDLDQPERSAVERIKLQEYAFPTNA